MGAFAHPSRPCGALSCPDHAAERETRSLRGEIGETLASIVAAADVLADRIGEHDIVGQIAETVRAAARIADQAIGLADRGEAEHVDVNDLLERLLVEVCEPLVGVLRADS